MIIKPFFRKAQKRMIMKRIFIVMAALMLMYGTGQAQSMYQKALLRKGITQTVDKDCYNDKERYEGVSFTAPNTEGQMLSYLILPGNNNTVALVQPKKKKDRYNDPTYIIPATVSYNGQTYTVTEIGHNAFNNSQARNVTLPSTVVYIATHAFSRSGLESMTIPESVKGIGECAFAAFPVNE